MLDTNTQWTVASAITTLIHLALTVLAYWDLRAALAGKVESQRVQNAAWYLLGQGGLLAIALDHAAVGFIAITMLPPPVTGAPPPAIWAQNLLIGGEWGGVVVAIAFWMARRVLTHWADERQVSKIADLLPLDEQEELT